MSEFLAANKLPKLTAKRTDGWIHFLHLYVKVVEDIPLEASLPNRSRGGRGAPEHISRVTVHFEQARQTIKHGDMEDVLFKVRWVIHDRDGRSGQIFVISSFSLRPDERGSYG